MADLPADLVPLPTQPWDVRPAELPLDVEECRTALWQSAGNISEAAELLKTTPARLRAKVKSSAYLSQEIAEAREQLQDIAEKNVREAMLDNTDPGRRDSMSRFVLASLGRSRGYGNQLSKTQPGPSGPASFRWEEEPTVVDAEAVEIHPGDNAKVVNG